VKIGDLVRLPVVANDWAEEVEHEYGLVLDISLAGTDHGQANVLWCGHTKDSWISVSSLEVFSKS
jgi:hypothetical protein